MAISTDLVGIHSKAQFLTGFFDSLATVKQVPASTRQHLALARSTCKHFLKPHQRLQHIASQKIPLGKDFNNAVYSSMVENVRQMPEVKSKTALVAALNKVEEVVKSDRTPTLQETVDMLQTISKEMPLPQVVLKPTLVAMANVGTFDVLEIDEIAGKVAAEPFTPDQVWDAVADRMEATRDGRVASLRKLGKPMSGQQNAKMVGYFQVIDVSKDKQFATMPITPGLANAMACGPQRANFTHLDKCDHPAARALIEDLTNLLIIGTNASTEDRERSVAITLRSMANDPMNISFRTIVEKSSAIPAPSGKSMPKQQAAAVDEKKQAGKEMTFAEVLEQLKQMGQTVAVPLDALDVVFSHLVSGGAATRAEIDQTKGELKTKINDKGEVTFGAIQDVILAVLGSKMQGAVQTK